MSYEHYVDCANCGTQVGIEGPDDTCLFCGKNATKKETEPPAEHLEPEQPESKPKEVIMVNSKEVPPKPKNRKQRDAYWEKNKEAVLADYQSMKLQPFLKRWSLATTTWIKLKKKWGVQNKTKRTGTGAKPLEQPGPKTVERATPLMITVPLSEIKQLQRLVIRIEMPDVTYNEDILVMAQQALRLNKINARFAGDILLKWTRYSL